MGETQIMEGKATEGIMTAQQAAIFLKECAMYRTLKDKIVRVAGETDLQQRIVDGIVANHPERDRDNIRRAVRGWLTNTNIETYIETETAIELCFIFKLPIETADAFVASVTEEGFHWRDPSQIPMIFCLSTGRYDYPEAVRLRDRILKSMPVVKKEDGVLYTEQVRNDLRQIGTEDELRDYMIQMAGRLGQRLNSAHRQFMEYMKLLEQPERAKYMPEEKKLTVRDVLKTYLHEAMIPKAQERQQILIEIAPAQQRVLRSIVSDWPAEARLSRMKNREINVSRKALILLFLATDGGYTGGEYDDYDDTEVDDVPSQDEVFADSRRRIDAMLVLCGYRPLDARNPFDWMILYVLSVEDICETDEQMDNILKALFKNYQEEERN